MSATPPTVASTLESMAAATANAMLPAFEAPVNAALLALVPPGTQIVVAPVLAAIESVLAQQLSTLISTFAPAMPTAAQLQQQADDAAKLQKALDDWKAALAAKP